MRNGEEGVLPVVAAVVLEFSKSAATTPWTAMQATQSKSRQQRQRDRWPPCLGAAAVCGDNLRLSLAGIS